MISGENGDTKYSAEGVGSYMLAFFDKLMRGISEQQIRVFVEKIIIESNDNEDVECIKNLFVIAFQTRWCRGGKGERKVFYILLRVLHEKFPFVVLELINLIPKFGYWKDLLSILDECRNKSLNYDELKNSVFRTIARQLEIDTKELETARKNNYTPQISLCAKYCPSEGGFYSKTMSADKELCKMLFPYLVGPQIDTDNISWHHARAKYRRLVGALRQALDIPETLMCANQWAEIQFKNVSSVCINRQKNAFLNETKKGTVAYPENPDRVACREILLKHIAEKGISGKQMFPHELVKQALRNNISEGVSSIINAQWISVRQGLITMVSERKKEIENAKQSNAEDAEKNARLSVSNKSVDFSRIVCMSDVSGSMTGTPMLVSIALGILISEIAHPTFKNKVLTFADTPTWHNLNPTYSFVEKVQSLSSADWGGSTDFYTAMQCIAELVKKYNLEQEQIPDLLVVSDMEFNTIYTENDLAVMEFAHYQKCNWDTVYGKISSLFYNLGLDMCDKPFIPPKIIFWNVRSDNIGYPVASDQEGVVMLSGFSPALLKFVLSGELLQDIPNELHTTNNNTVNVENKVDPSEMLLRVLHDPALDSVREVLDNIKKHNFRISM